MKPGRSKSPVTLKRSPATASAGSWMKFTEVSPSSMKAKVCRIRPWRSGCGPGARSLSERRPRA